MDLMALPSSSNNIECSVPSDQNNIVLSSHTVPSKQTMLANSVVRHPLAQLQTDMLRASPLPYQIQEFKSSTVLKKFEPSKRISEIALLSPKEDFEIKRKKAIILHSDRYAKKNLISRDGSQKARLEQEEYMLNEVRNRMRLRDAIVNSSQDNLQLGGAPIKPPKNLKPLPLVRSPQRQLRYDSKPLESYAPLTSQIKPPDGETSFSSFAEWEALSSVVNADRASSQRHDEKTNVPAFGGGLEKLKMDGVPAHFTARYNLAAELVRLKALVLPDFAKDLYVGRGISLPGCHALNMPRRPPPRNDDVFNALVKISEEKSKKKNSVGDIKLASSTDNNSEVFITDVSKDPKFEEITKRNSASTTRKSPQSLDPLQEINTHESDESNTYSDFASLSASLNLSRETENYIRLLHDSSSREDRFDVSVQLARRISSMSEGVRLAIDRGLPRLEDIAFCLDLFYEVDRENKGQITVSSMESIAASIKEGPLTVEESEFLATLIQTNEMVDRLIFLALIPYLLFLKDSDRLRS